MKCRNCGALQDEGKFCGTCGGALVPVEAQAASTPNEQGAQPTPQQQPASHQQTEQGSDSFEKVKETSKAYGGFFKSYLQAPSRIFDNPSKEFVNGVINIAIALVLIALTFNVIMKNALGSLSYFLPSGTSIFFNVFIYLLLMVAIVITILFVVNKLFGTDWSFTQMVGLYGIHMIPTIILVVAALLLGVLQAIGFATLIWFIAILLMVSATPLYLLGRLLSIRSKGIDPFYAYLVYVGAVIIALAIFFGIVEDSSFGSMFTDYGW